MGEPQVIPRPVRMRTTGGVFPLGPNTTILASPENESAAEVLSQLLSPATGFAFQVELVEGGRGAPDAISLLNAEKDLGQEGYALSVQPDRIVIRSSGRPGALYACQTLRQLLPHAIESKPLAPGVAWTVPQVEIEDAPRFPWRGYLLDSSRHFQSKECVKRLIDAMALYKLNRFHWHLFDIEAWRMEIAGWPELTAGPPGADTDAGLYSRSDVDEVIKYAASRCVTVYPEVEMPGHCRRAVTAYPQLRCPGAPEGTCEVCLGSDTTVTFFQEVLDQVMAAFPDAIIHMGGDEASDEHWKTCPACQARMKEHGLPDERMLQKWFMELMTRYVHDKGRGTIAWADHQDLGWPQGQLVQGWRDGESRYAITHGLRTINSTHDFVYFDYPIAPNAIKSDWMHLLPLEKVHSFDPSPSDSTAREAADLVLGSEACLWTENVPERKVFEKTFPRLLAFSEVVWSPRALRDWPDFEKRAQGHLGRLDAMGLEYWKPSGS